MVDLTILITSGRPHFTQPDLEPVDALQFVIQKFPSQWRNCLDFLVDEIGANPLIVERLRNGDLSAAAGTPKVLKKVNEFLSYRLPQAWRTLKDANEVRQWLRIRNMSVQILFVREQGHIPPDLSEACREFEVEICQILSPSLMVPWNEVLPKVQGRILLMIPGGVKLFSPSVEAGLRLFDTDPEAGALADGTLAFFFRVEAMREILEQDLEIPPDTKEIGLLIAELGYSPHMNKSLEVCVIEDMYLRDETKRIFRGSPPETTDDVVDSILGIPPEGKSGCFSLVILIITVVTLLVIIGFIFA